MTRELRARLGNSVGCAPPTFVPLAFVDGEEMAFEIEPHFITAPGTYRLVLAVSDDAERTYAEWNLTYSKPFQVE